MTPLHLAMHVAAGLFIIAGAMFAAAAITLQNKGWHHDAFECAMCALGCAFVTALIW